MKVDLLIKLVASFYFLISVVIVVALSSPVMLASSPPQKNPDNDFDWKTDKYMENLTYDKIEVPGTHKEVQSVLT